MNTNTIFLKSNSIHEIIGLHNILHKSKFYENLDDLYSQFGALWSNQLVDTIIEYYISNEDLASVESWRNWRILSFDKLEYTVIINKLNSLNQYLKDNQILLSDEERVKTIRNIASPFIINDDMLQIFLSLLK